MKTIQLSLPILSITPIPAGSNGSNNPGGKEAYSAAIITAGHAEVRPDPNGVGVPWRQTPSNMQYLAEKAFAISPTLLMRNGQIDAAHVHCAKADHGRFKILRKHLDGQVAPVHTKLRVGRFVHDHRWVPGYGVPEHANKLGFVVGGLRQEPSPSAFGPA